MFSHLPLVVSSRGDGFICPEFEMRLKTLTATSPSRNSVDWNYFEIVDSIFCGLSGVMWILLFGILNF